MKKMPSRTILSMAAIGSCVTAATLKLAQGQAGEAHRYGLAATTMFLAPTLLPNCSWWGPVVRHFKTKERLVWLTIDDGPDPLDTPEILDVLARYDASATFFAVGRKVDRFPDLARLVVTAGHEMANHTWSHRAFSFWAATPHYARREIARCSESIRAAAGKVPTLFRAPAGLANPCVHGAAMRAELRMLGWSAAGQDGIRHDPQKVIDRISRNLCPGSIILLHEGPVPGIRPGSRAKTLEKLLKELRNQDLKTLTTNSAGFFT